MGSRIDLRQEVAGLDLLSFAKRDLLELTVDLRLDRHCVEGLNRPEAGQVDGHIPRRGRFDGDGNRSGGGWRGRGACTRAGAAGPYGDTSDDGQNDADHSQEPSPTVSRLRALGCFPRFFFHRATPPATG